MSGFIILWGAKVRVAIGRWRRAIQSLAGSILRIHNRLDIGMAYLEQSRVALPQREANSPSGSGFLAEGDPWCSIETRDSCVKSQAAIMKNTASMISEATMVQVRRRRRSSMNEKKAERQDLGLLVWPDSSWESKGPSSSSISNFSVLELTWSNIVYRGC